MSVVCAQVQMACTTARGVLYGLLQGHTISHNSPSADYHVYWCNSAWHVAWCTAVAALEVAIALLRKMFVQMLALVVRSYLWHSLSAARPMLCTTSVQVELLLMLLQPAPAIASLITHV